MVRFMDRLGRGRGIAGSTNAGEEEVSATFHGFVCLAKWTIWWQERSGRQCRNHEFIVCRRTMKRLACFLTAVLVSVSAFADPLRKENVSADARWILHLDVQNLLSTQLGEFFAREFVDKQLAKPVRDIERQFGIVF